MIAFWMCLSIPNKTYLTAKNTAEEIVFRHFDLFCGISMTLTLNFMDIFTATARTIDLKKIHIDIKKNIYIPMTNAGPYFGPIITDTIIKMWCLYNSQFLLHLKYIHFSC